MLVDHITVLYVRNGDDIICSFEKEFYENDARWNPLNIDETERKRIEDTYRLLPTGIDNLLDLGCGNGIFSNFVGKKNPIDIISLDRSSTALKYVNTEKIIGDIENIPFRANEFDCITCLEVIEHLPFKVYELALDEIARVAKKYIIISVPYKQNRIYLTVRCPYCKSFFTKNLHMRSFDENTMSDLLKDRGFVSKKLYHIGKSNDYWILSSLFRKYALYKRIKTESIGISKCPICGYQQEILTSISDLKPKEKKVGIRGRIFRSCYGLIKRHWPHSYKYTWIVALYERT